MSKLIEALNIFLKYGDPECPTVCQGEILCVLIDPKNVSEEDIRKLDELTFEAANSCGYFYSHFFGNNGS